MYIAAWYINLYFRLIFQELWENLYAVWTLPELPKFTVTAGNLVCLIKYFLLLQEMFLEIWRITVVYGSEIH
jgi:hypothetical protein